MAKLSDEEKEKIIKRDLPGYKLVSEPPGGFSKSQEADSSRLPVESTTPDLAALRRKYFGEEEADNASAASPQNYAAESVEGGAAEDLSPPDDDDDEIVAVEPESKRDAWDRGSRPKSVVVSGSKKKVIGSQG